MIAPAARASWLDPLDAARRVVLLRASRWPGVGPVLARRDLRLLAQSSLGVAATFALVLVAPGVPYVLGPALFGVAHVASEARFLVVRRAVPRAWLAALAVGALALVASRALESWRPSAAPFGVVELSIGGALALAGALAGGGIARAPLRTILVTAPLAACVLAAVAHPALARLTFAHAHNVVTIALWACLFRRRRAHALPALVLATSGAAFLASGAWTAHLDYDGPWARRFVDEALFAWPFGALSQPRALGLGLAFAFLQSVHYAVWLSWIPQEDVRAEGTTTFRMAQRSLVRDLGAAGVAATLLLMLLVVGASLVDVHRTRGLYLSLATFHGYLELAQVAFLVARGASRA